MKLTQKRVRLMIRRRKEQLCSNAENDPRVKIRDGLESPPLAVGLTVENSVDGRLGDLQPFSECDLTQAGSGLDLGEHLGGRLVHDEPFYTHLDRPVNAQMDRNLFLSYTDAYIPRMNIAERIDLLMKLRGIPSQSALSRQSGVPQPTINRLLKGTTANPDLPTLQKLAVALSSNTTWLADGVGPGPDSPDHRPSNHVSADLQTPNYAGEQALLGASDKIPTADTRKAFNRETGNVPIPLQYSIDNRNFRPVFVVGRAQGGMPERIWTDGDYPVGVTDQYAVLATTDPHAFLTPIVGTSMAPRFNPGEFALVEPETPPELEDDVLVRLATGETMLKRLVSRRGGVQLASYNEPGTMLYAEGDITWMYYVAHPVPARKIKQRV